MRTLLALTVAAALLVPSGAASSTATRPALRLVDLAPLTVSGVGFAAGERLKVTAVVGTVAHVRFVRSSRAGSFLASFPRVTIERCGGTLEVKAVGSTGSRATLQPKLPQLLCPPPLSPA